MVVSPSWSLTIQIDYFNNAAHGLIIYQSPCSSVGVFRLIWGIGVHNGPHGTFVLYLPVI